MTQGRLISVTDVTEEGGLEIEEEFSTVERAPRYEVGNPSPVEWIDVPTNTRRRRIVTDPTEIESIKRKLTQ